MCIIILAAPGIEISEEHLKQSNKNNGDGAGLAWVDKDEVQIFKSLSFSEVLDRYKEVFRDFKDTPIVVHFRKKSKGDISIANCHPFRVNDKMVFVHNGTITNKQLLVKKDESDTKAFNEDFLQKLPIDWWENDAIIGLIENFIDGGKLVFLTANREYMILNEDSAAAHWNKEKTIWYSNYSYYGGVSSLQRVEPTPFQLNNPDGYPKTRYSGRPFYRAGYEDWLDWPADEDDWTCSNCGEFNWKTVQVCQCGAAKVNGVIFKTEEWGKSKYTSNNNDRSIFVPCTTCGCYSPLSDKICRHCQGLLIDHKKDHDKDVKKLSDIPLLANKGVCSFCGSMKNIVVQTPYGTKEIKLCEKCTSILERETEMFFPKHLLKYRQSAGANA